MTSVYKTDFGNGVVIYADDYVKTGQWVYDCKYSRLINRRPLSAPIAELEKTGMLTIGNMYSLNNADEAQAKESIRAITGINGWHKKLHYLYTGLNESSNIAAHVFYLLGRHNGRDWVLTIRHRVYLGESIFTVTAKPYQSETFIDHTKMLQLAAQSCPVS
ncbi:hypothetical protein ACCD10_29675 [Pseudomonas sp. Pseusp122]|uniref:hypothetical protein n=1 Tax=unclassified Pseudomonas TaxID=196821 RepID=UPI0039A53627